MKKWLIAIMFVTIASLITGCSSEVDAIDASDIDIPCNIDTFHVDEKYLLDAEQESVAEENLVAKEYSIVDTSSLEITRVTWSFYAWDDFRNDTSTFFKSVVELSANWIIDDFWGNVQFADGWVMPDYRISESIIRTIALQVSTAKNADPALYAEIVESIEYVLEKLGSCDKIHSLFDVYYANIQLTVPRTHQDCEFVRFGSDYEPRWIEGFDWEVRDVLPFEPRWIEQEYMGSRNAESLWGDIDYIAFMFEYGATEQGILWVMHLMLHAVSGFEPDCSIWIMAAVDEEIRDIIMYGLVERIVTLKHGGFDIYMEYIEMLTDPRRVFDPRTKEVHERVSQLIEERVR